MKVYIRHKHGLVDAAKITEYTISDDGTALHISTAATRPHTAGHVIAHLPQRTTWRTIHTDDNLAAAGDIATALVVAIHRAESLSAPSVITYTEDNGWTVTPLADLAQEPATA
jgi:hypothetical protein